MATCTSTYMRPEEFPAFSSDRSKVLITWFVSTMPDEASVWTSKVEICSPTKYIELLQCVVRHGQVCDMHPLKVR